MTINIEWYKKQEWFTKTPKVRYVAFICLGNTCRSPSAEFFFNDMTHWWNFVKAFSRGVKDGLPELKAKDVDFEGMALEAKKVIGDRNSKILQNHTAHKISHSDTKHADLILTMEKHQRDFLRKEFPDQSYKIFTLKGFVEQNDDHSIADLNIGNPFTPPENRGKSGSVKYYKYIQNYMHILLIIKQYIRKLIETIYILNKTKR